MSSTPERSRCHSGLHARRLPSANDDMEQDDLESPPAPSMNDHTKRKLKPRHVQLMSIGGTVGTILFVAIGRGLMEGGPGNLVLAFSLWCGVILAINVSLAEMVCYLPISSPFIRFAGRWVDEALEFAAGWNYFVYQAILVPFEVVACSFILRYWTDVIPDAAVIATVLVLYAFLNIVAVEWFGESEFWASIFKVVLAFGLLFYTIIVMSGGNPKHDSSGFHYWKDPGTFAPWPRGSDGAVAHFLGFFQCFILACLSVAGPEYISISAGETENPRGVLPRVFKSVFYRLACFFIIGALCVGVLVPYDDPALVQAYNNSKDSAAASPYVISMNRLNIRILPHIFNAMILTAAFSAGNSYVYCASRSLYGLALEGKAPRFLAKCLPSGVPVYSVLSVLAIALLAFLQVSEGSAIVLNWFISLVTSSQLINFLVICVTYICFFRAAKVQGLDRKSLPYHGWGQPYVAGIAAFCTSTMILWCGYKVFLPGFWDTTQFLFSYTMVIVFPFLYFGWKLYHKSPIVKPEEADLHEGLEEIENHERDFIARSPSSRFERFLDRLFG